MLDKIYRFILWLLHLPAPEKVGAAPKDVILYRRETDAIILERIYPYSPAQVQLWRVSIKGGEPWALIVTLSEMSALRQEIGLRRGQGQIDPELGEVSRILQEFPSSSHLVTFSWHYWHRFKAQSPPQTQTIQTLLMEPVDLVNGLYFAHPNERSQFLARLMLIYLQIVLRLQPAPNKPIKLQIGQLKWMKRLEIVAQQLIHPEHKLQPAEMRQRWKRIGYRRSGGES